MSFPCAHALILSVVLSLWESNLDCYGKVSYKFSIYLFIPVISAVMSFKYTSTVFIEQFQSKLLFRFLRGLQKVLQLELNSGFYQ